MIDWSLFLHKSSWSSLDIPHHIPSARRACISGVPGATITCACRDGNVIMLNHVEFDYSIYYNYVYIYIHILRVYSIYIYHYIFNGMLTWDFFSSAKKKDPKRMLGQLDFIFSSVLKGNAHMAIGNPELNLHKTYCKISRPSGTNRVIKTPQHLFFSGHVHKPTRAINAINMSNGKKNAHLPVRREKDKIMGCWHSALRKVSTDLRL